MTKKTIAFIIILIACSFPSAYADQAAWLEKSQAHQAAERIDPGAEIRLYCLPCGDATWTSLSVSKVEIKKKSGKYYQIYVNDSGIDLAYTYVREGEKWRNLGMIAKVPVSDVPEFLEKGSVPPVEDYEHPIDGTLRKCIDADPTTQGMLNCIYNAQKMWDDDLNRLYQLLRRDLTPEGREKLKQSQREWIAYRDREFAFIDTMFKQFDGSMYLPMLAESKMRIVKDRTLEIYSYTSLFEMEPGEQ